MVSPGVRADFAHFICRPLRGLERGLGSSPQARPPSPGAGTLSAGFAGSLNNFSQHQQAEFWYEPAWSTSSQTAIAKAQAREYTPCPHLPPLTNKVSQVEMEAGDCEGRLPPLFLPAVRGSYKCWMLYVRC